MKTYGRMLALFLVGLSLAAVGSGQKGSQLTPLGIVTDAGSAEVAISPEQKLVVSVYEKLVIYNNAATLLQADRRIKSPKASSDMAFGFSNFRSGPIKEILNFRNKDLVTQPSGEIISVNHAKIREDAGEERAAYTAQWVPGQYSSGYDRQWTIGDLLGFEPAKYYDVGNYASYEVTVSFQGRKRTYRALVLFHNLYKSPDAVKAEFWDTVVGMGGSLTQLSEEKLSPYTTSPTPVQSQDAPNGAGTLTGNPEFKGQTADVVNIPLTIPGMFPNSPRATGNGNGLNNVLTLGGAATNPGYLKPSRSKQSLSFKRNHSLARLSSLFEIDPEGITTDGVSSDNTS
jgi:hypothetical protein